MLTESQNRLMDEAIAATKPKMRLMSEIDTSGKPNKLLPHQLYYATVIRYLAGTIAPKTETDYLLHE